MFYKKVKCFNPVYVQSILRSLKSVENRIIAILALGEGWVSRTWYKKDVQSDLKLYTTAQLSSHISVGLQDE
jgi:hypothetical protein